MAFELDPQRQTSVSLPNSAWVFITDVLRKLPYGSLVDVGQQGLLIQLNSQIISSNQPAEEPKDEVQ